MIAALGVDELNVDAHPIAASLHGALKDVAHVQLAPDPPDIERSAFVGKGRVPRDDERAVDAR